MNSLILIFAAFRVLHSLITLCTLERDMLFPPPFSLIAPSPSHSPLPVLCLFGCIGTIRHIGAVQVRSRIKKTHLLTTNIQIAPNIVNLILRHFKIHYSQDLLFVCPVFRFHLFGNLKDNLWQLIVKSNLNSLVYFFQI